ncbi:hypothetical protein AX774_g5482 [Zancudomyces culisetae]|uniref:BSD domain-containing protein n=1 Tax=Zancudomyces culisetae TaxID=1213189 RepID=A0A1R1PJD4_ZANCU|nr:hypothetical protein AX774_g5482 [Zancudomyces culisetae]|eukprot:OMH81068.1 hypothetical protein AX774_g5482 [Zancudomyces culisetae]
MEDKGKKIVETKDNKVTTEKNADADIESSGNIAASKTQESKELDTTNNASEEKDQPGKDTIKDEYNVQVGLDNGQNESTPERTTAAVGGSIFGISGFWGQNNQNTQQFNKFVDYFKKGVSLHQQHINHFMLRTIWSEELVLNYKQDVKGLTKLVKSGAKKAAEGINSGIETLKENVKAEMESLEKIGAGEGESGEIVEYDERGIPIVATKDDFVGIDNKISEAVDVVTAKAAGGMDLISGSAKSDTSSVTGTSKAAGELGEQENTFVKDMTSEFSKMVKGFENTFSKEILERSKVGVSSYVKKIGQDIEDFTKKAISIVPPSDLTDIHGFTHQSLKERERLALLYQIEDNEITYLSDPSVSKKELDSYSSSKNADTNEDKPYQLEVYSEDVSKLFKTFVDSYKHDDYTKKINTLIENNKAVARYYKELVPTKLRERLRSLVTNAIEESNDDEFDWEMDDEAVPEGKATLAESGTQGDEDFEKINKSDSGAPSNNETSPVDTKNTTVSQNKDATKKDDHKKQADSKDLSADDWDSWE